MPIDGDCRPPQRWPDGDSKQYKEKKKKSKPLASAAQNCCRQMFARADPTEGRKPASVIPRSATIDQLMHQVTFFVGLQRKKLARRGSEGGPNQISHTVRPGPAKSRLNMRPCASTKLHLFYCSWRTKSKNTLRKKFFSTMMLVSEEEIDKKKKELECKKIQIMSSKYPLSHHRSCALASTSVNTGTFGTATMRCCFTCATAAFSSIFLKRHKYATAHAGARPIPAVQ